MPDAVIAEPLPSATPPATELPTPSVRRRVLVMVYETFLLLAVDMLAVALYLVVTRNHHEAVYQHGLKLFLFLVTGAYFVRCWTDSGHTLAMKTWRVRLIANGGGQPRPSLRTATLRYLLAWGWFLPALIVCALFGLRGKTEVGIAVAIGIAVWAMTAFLDKDRQFLHDRLAGTRLVQMPKAAATAPAAS
jgi:uncharacterized RDD family membrane protein YckC